MSGKYDRVRTLFNFSNSMTLHDLFKFSMTIGGLIAFTCKHLQKFTCSRVERDKDKLWCKPKCVTFNYRYMS